MGNADLMAAGWVVFGFVLTFLFVYLLLERYKKSLIAVIVLALAGVVLFLASPTSSDPRWVPWEKSGLCGSPLCKGIKWERLRTPDPAAPVVVQAPAPEPLVPAPTRTMVRVPHPRVKKKAAVKRPSPCQCRQVHRWMEPATNQ